MDCQKNSLSVNHLRVQIKDYKNTLTPIIDNVHLRIPQGRIVALVGESGCGKTLTSLAIMNLLQRNIVASGEIFCNGHALHSMSARQRAAYNGSLLGLIFQEPVEALDPLFTIEQQMWEGLKRHKHVSRKAGHAIICNGLKRVNFQNPTAILQKYPHELSGGMCQRVMIASVLTQEVAYIIADEPTTALDVTIQKQILIQLYRLSRDQNIGILFITHDLSAVAEIADYVYIMKQGSILEEGDVFSIFDKPKYTYTKELIARTI